MGCSLTYNQRMLSQYHIEILLAALGEHFSPRAMSVITYANINQDRLSGLIGHDEFHFDNNSFAKTYAYIEEQRSLAASSLEKGNADPAWRAFGRILHAVQDFYAHSNYVTLWLGRFEGPTPPPPSEIDPMDPNLIDNPDLRSGNVYFPLDWLYFIKRLRPTVLRLIPRDSHAWMNLDSPEQGFKFDYAMQAAVKRTVIESERTTKGYSEVMYNVFLDK
jgi:hypothetical protein